MPAPVAPFLREKRRAKLTGLLQERQRRRRVRHGHGVVEAIPLGQVAMRPRYQTRAQQRVVGQPLPRHRDATVVGFAAHHKHHDLPHVRRERRAHPCAPGANRSANPGTINVSACVTTVCGSVARTRDTGSNACDWIWQTARMVPPETSRWVKVSADGVAITSPDHSCHDSPHNSSRR